MFIRKCLAALVVLTVLFMPAGMSAGQTIVVVGDSVSSGYGLTAEQSWVAQLSTRLQSEGYGYEVVNASIAGDTSAGGRARLPRLLAQHNPAIVVIELGGNDGLRGLPVDKLRENLAEMIEMSQRARRQGAVWRGCRFRRTTGRPTRARFPPCTRSSRSASTSRWCRF